MGIFNSIADAGRSVGRGIESGARWLGDSGKTIARSFGSNSRMNRHMMYGAGVGATGGYLNSNQGEGLSGAAWGAGIGGRCWSIWYRSSASRMENQRN